MNKITNASRFLFEELVSRIQERSSAVGIAVAIVDRNGKTQYEKFFGYRDQEKKLPIDEDTIFGLASVTKSFVALSIMQLVEAGKVDLDDPVSKYIPEFTNRNQKPIKLWHFLCHTAGFYPMHRTIINEIAQKAGLDENETGDFAFCEKIALEGTKAVAELLDAQTKENGGLIGDPGNYMSYCNDGFGLLSEIVRRVGGENSFAEYVKKHILEPLHMERSSGEYVRPAADANAAVLYKMQNGVMTSGRDYHDNAFSLGGAGSLKSTLADMKKYICMYLNYGKGIDGTRILSQEGVRTMCRPRIDYRPDSHYCFGLAQKKLDDLITKKTLHEASLPPTAWLIDPVFPDIIKEYIVSYAVNERDLDRFTKLARANSVLGLSAFLSRALEDWPANKKLQKIAVTPPGEVLNYFEYYVGLLGNVDRKSVV